LATKEKLFKLYTGITVNQFNHLFGVLEKVGNVYELRYWKGKKTKSKKRRKNRMKQNKITPRNIR
jgi:hypothetical protein